MNKQCVGLLAVALGVLALSGAAGAEEYAKGNGALEEFDGEGMAASPLWVQIWVGFMLLTFAMGLLVYSWRRVGAALAAGGFAASAFGGPIVFDMMNLPMLSGAIAIAHLVCWMPALLVLLGNRPFLDASELRGYRLWSGVMTFVILFSFVFDIRDAAIYIDHVAGLGMLS